MHFTSSLRKNPCSSVAPAAHQKPSSRTRSKSKESVKRPIRAHRLNPCFLIKASRMASVLLRAICGRPQVSRMAIPHSASEGNTDFFAVLLVFSPTDHADFHRCRFTPPAKNLCLSAAPASAICGSPQASRMAIPHSISEGNT